MESLTERNPNKRRGEEQKRREVEKFNSRVETPNKREEIRGSILLLTEVQNILLGRLRGNPKQ